MNKRIDLVCIAGRHRNTDVLHVPPYGILYVGSSLKRAGYNVVLHHIPSSLIREEARKIADEKPLFAGFSVFTGFPASASVKMSEMLKAINPDIPIVWGGVHPSAMPEQCLKEKSIDYVVMGEGEETAVELAECIEKCSGFSDIKGLGWKHEGRIFINPPRPFINDLDHFLVDWGITDPERYVETSIDGKRIFTFISSRGCRGTCGFCYNMMFNRRRWRAHSIDYFMSQVCEFKKRYGITHLLCNDDNFFEDEGRAIDIIERLDSTGIHLIFLEMRVSQIRYELVQRLQKLGVNRIFIGWESGSDRILKLIRKGITVKTIREKIRILSDFPSIAIEASAIIGFPTETKQEIYQTVDLALEMARIHPRISFNLGLYLPYPGTPLYELAKKEGFKEPFELYILKFIKKINKYLLKLKGLNIYYE